MILAGLGRPPRTLDLSRASRNGEVDRSTAPVEVEAVDVSSTSTSLTQWKKGHPNVAPIF